MCGLALARFIRLFFGDVVPRGSLGDVDYSDEIADLSA
jgi:hypothetical protein